MAKAIFRANPGRFERYALKRVYFFWVGVPHPIDGKLMTEVFRELNYSFLSLSGLLGLALAIRRRRPGADALCQRIFTGADCLLFRDGVGSDAESAGAADLRAWCLSFSVGGSQPCLVVARL